LIPSPEPAELKTLVPALPTPYTLGVERLEARVQGQLLLPEHAVPLLVDDKTRAVIAALVVYGEGSVLVLGAPELASNAALLRADNAQFWLSTLRVLATSGEIAFDEYHHGFTGERSIADFGAR